MNDDPMTVFVPDDMSVRSVDVGVFWPVSDPDGNPLPEAQQSIPLLGVTLTGTIIGTGEDVTRRCFMPMAAGIRIAQMIDDLALRAFEQSQMRDKARQSLEAMGMDDLRRLAEENGWT